MLSNSLKMYFDASAAGGAAAADSDESQDNNQDQSQQQQEETIEAWFETLDPKLKEKGSALLTARLEKLQNTVKATREERDNFQSELKKLAKAAGKDSDLGKQLEGMSAKLDEANQKADFMEEALANNCHNPAAAFIIAKQKDTFSKSGAIDWAALQKLVPEFFGDRKQTNKKKTAGAGNGKDQPSAMGMNDWIRQQAGR